METSKTTVIVTVLNFAILFPASTNCYSFLFSLAGFELLLNTVLDLLRVYCCF